MTERAKTLLIGSFIIIACLAMLGTLLFLRPSVGDGKKKLFVCFTSIEKVQIGTRVTFAGRAVGEVIAIDPIFDARNQPTGRSGHVCFYELELALDSHTVVYDTDEIVMHTTGLLGERTIAIVPKAVKKGQPSYPVTDQIMYGKSGDPVEETLNQIISIGTKVGETVDQLKEILMQNKAEIPLTLKSIRDASTQIKIGFEAINSSHLIYNISDAASNFQNASKKLNTILASWEEGNLGTTFPALSKNLADITDALNQKDELRSIVKNLSDHLPPILHDFGSFSRSLNNPCSTIGKLLNNDEVFLQLTALMTKASIIFDDVNNYGILFHLDKSWQRERLKRLNLLNSLCRPQDFNAYFDKEVNDIYCSLSRIEKSIEKAGCSKNRQALVHDRNFNDGFSELVQRLGNVEETLKIFRELVIEQDCCKKRTDSNGLTTLFQP